MRRLIFLVVVIGLFSIGLFFYFKQCAPADAPTLEAPDPSSNEAFLVWRDDSDGDRTENAAAHQELAQLLESEGVGDVVPVWQLFRVDANYAARCETGFFDIPPRELWPNIVPALRLVRDEVKPVVGQVSVVSSWRNPEINECVNGASKSRHLNFEALDLVPKKMTSQQDHFGKLCEMHRSRGRAANMGLGAYFDPDDTDRNKRGRFHVDAKGFRTWGFGYTGESSPCHKLN